MQPHTNSVGVIKTVDPLTIQVSGLVVPARLRAHAVTVTPTVGQTWETHVEGHVYWLDRPILTTPGEGTTVQGLPDLTLTAEGRIVMNDANGPIFDMNGLLDPHRRLWAA